MYNESMFLVGFPRESAEKILKRKYGCKGRRKTCPRSQY